MQWKDRIGRRLKLQDMHILLAAVESGSMAKAAEHLAISQPVVSRAIASLEHTLGVRLLDRSRSGITPTLYGRALLTHGLAAFNELKRGVKAIEFLADPTTGELRIGSTETMAAGLLGAIIEELSAKYPRLTIHVTLGYPPEMQDRELRTRTVDLIVGRLPGLVPAADTDVEVLFDDKSHVVAGAENRWTRRRRFELLDLMNELWCLPPPESFPGNRIVTAFRAHKLEFPRATVMTSSMQLTHKMLATGRFLSILPGSMLHFNARALSLKTLSVEAPTQPWPVGIVFLKNRTLSPAAQLFIDCARKMSKALRNLRC
jgi:DNA-binding transcriptional LysR family regulator